ncbi:MAG: Carboxypeptidase regulatory-like domain [Chthonomonadales bacterium]|nr:Carboxypeptidase regulatory-like domain [Chthonomonadales bacterium]
MSTYCFFSPRRLVPRDFSRLFTPRRFAYRSLSHGLAAFALALVALASTPSLARAEDMVNINGRVYADDGKTPLGDAEVVIVNDKNKVVATGKTDAEGKYSLPVPRKYLHLPAGKKRSSFLGGLAEELVGETIGMINPVAGMGYELVKGLSGTMQHSGASQADIARMSAGRVTQEDGDRLLAAGARKQDVEKMLKYSAENFDADGNFIPSRNAPGALSLKVALAGHKEASGVGQIYWMQTDKVRAENGREKRETNAWLDPLTLVTDNSETSSRFARNYFTLTNAHLDPATVEAGQTITLTVTLSVPSEQNASPLVVIARHSKTGKIYELTPMGEGGVYQCQIEVDKKFPKKEQLISVVAYPQKSEKPGRDAKVEHALEEAGVWKLDKPYVYNPVLLASRNRADVLLTVVKPSR